MKDSDWTERLRKRELRIMLREKIMLHKTQERERASEDKRAAASKNEKIAIALREDNKKSKPSRKRPGPGMFIEMYSYIPITRFDKRNAIPRDWVARSFNERLQHREFIKKFIYPYSMPEILLWASRQKESILEKPSPDDCYIIRLSKKWICDIVSGESFYKRNKDRFTRAEAHWFLNASLSYDSLDSVIERMYYAKCRAIGMNHKLSVIISSVFVRKFGNQYIKHPLVIGFLDLISRTTNYQFDSGIVSDISDFILNKVHEYLGDSKFSLSGRTIISLVALANEWHRDLQREKEARDAARHQIRHADRWSGLGIENFNYQQDDFIWTISEIKTFQALVNEGRKMKNCVASYDYKCATGQCSIFSVSRWYEINKITDNIATLEVNRSDRTLVQAKGKCNSKVTDKVMNIVTRWARKNRIKIKLL
jgi:hypothetical protein